MSELIVPHESRTTLRPAYSAAVRIWGALFALLILILDQAFLAIQGKALLEDFLTLGLIGVLGWMIGKTFQVKYLHRKDVEIRISNIASAFPSFPHVIVSAAGIFFLLLWLSRWSLGLEAALQPEDTLRYRTFLHAGSLLSLAALIASSQRVRSWWGVFDLTPGRMVLISYGVATLIGAFLLVLPISLQPGASIEIIDAFFISVASVTVTGLSPVSIPETFSTFGQLVILAGIQIGGLGIVVLSVGLAVVTRERLSLSESLMGREIYDLPEIGKIKDFLIRVVLFTLIIEAIGFLWIYLSLPSDLPRRGYHAVFHAISAFCNSGISSLPEGLDVPGLFAVKTGVAVLVFLGAIGFPILFEIYDRMTGRPSRHSWTPYFILMGWASLILFLGGGLAIFMIEAFREGSIAGIFDRLGEAFFYSATSRTAGFNVSKLEMLDQASQLVLLVLMMIGGGSISAAGGVKVATAAILVIATYSLLKGNKWIQFRSSEISPFILQKCVSIVVLFIFVAFISVLILIGLTKLDPWLVTFEVVAALSTGGMSLGATPDLGPMGKLIVIMLMFIGRLGLLTMVYAGVGTMASQRFRFPEERYYVG